MCGRIEEQGPVCHCGCQNGYYCDNEEICRLVVCGDSKCKGDKDCSSCSEDRGSCCTTHGNSNSGIVSCCSGLELSKGRCCNPDEVYSFGDRKCVDCISDSDCSSGEWCSSNHCCPDGEEWNSRLEQCRNPNDACSLSTWPTDGSISSGDACCDDFCSAGDTDYDCWDEVQTY